MHQRRLLKLVVLFLGVLMVGNLFGEESPPLPSASDAWVNSAPLTGDATRGKAVFLWFYEET